MNSGKNTPLRIDSVRLDSGGEIGMTLCPGKKQRGALSGDWKRNLAEDLEVIIAWDAVAVVSVIEKHELGALGVADLGTGVSKAGIAWYHLAVPDFGVPDDQFEQAWISAGREVRQALKAGKKILVHCKGGLGRTGTLAARLLVELGESPEAAIRKVRQARPGAIETSEQRRHVLACQRTID